MALLAVARLIFTSRRSADPWRLSRRPGPPVRDAEVDRFDQLDLIDYCW